MPQGADGVKYAHAGAPNQEGFSDGAEAVVGAALRLPAQAEGAAAPPPVPKPVPKPAPKPAPAMRWIGDQQGNCVLLNRALRDVWGVPADRSFAFDWTRMLHPDDADAVAASLAAGTRDLASSVKAPGVKAPRVLAPRVLAPGNRCR